MIIFVNPAQLSGFDIIIYLLDIIFLPILLITAYFWWNRKRIFPYLMIVFFLMIGIKEVVYLIGDASPNYFNIAASIVWLIYFFRSERVQQTFTKLKEAYHTHVSTFQKTLRGRTAFVVSFFKIRQFLLTRFRLGYYYNKYLMFCDHY